MVPAWHPSTWEAELGGLPGIDSKPAWVAL